MMRLTIILMMVTGYQLMMAQNLVPNGSFEQNGSIDCGIYTAPNFNNSVSSWFAAGGTPDLYSNLISQSCFNHMPNSTYSGPIGLKGSQIARTGRIFAGIFSYTINGMNNREYIGVPLSSPLIPGHNYCVEFYVSFADNHEKASNNLGAYFSTSPMNGSGGVIAVTPEINTTNMITDSTNWVLVSGNFHATDAFNYLTIGNFYNDAGTTCLSNPNATNLPGTYGAYYFIDDVSVMECSASIEEPGITDINIYPNPASEILKISNPSSQAISISISNLHGEMVLQKNVSTPITEIDIQTYANGIYFVKVESASDSFTRKIIIQ